MPSDKRIPFEYIMSGTSMMGLHPEKYVRDMNLVDKLKDYVASTSGIFNHNIDKRCKHTKPMLSALYNAYQEAEFIDIWKELGNIGAEQTYADSGGLQMVTRGVDITDDIKKTIYQNQTYADYAFCFDVIAVETLQVSSHGRAERLNISNRVFNVDKHPGAGTATGINIKTQIDYFRSVGAKTKVLIIVQGNTPEDMVVFYNKIAEQLSEEDYEYIGGLAVAYPCMGTGELESIDMLRAAHKISNICHPNVLKQFHMLGVGAVNRLRPLVYLIRSGYLGKFEKVSYDSSSHCMMANHGEGQLNGKRADLGKVKTDKAVAFFDSVYDEFSAVIAPTTKAEFEWLMFCQETGSWKRTPRRDKAKASGSDHLVMLTQVSEYMHCLMAVGDFIVAVDNVFNEQAGNPIPGFSMKKSTFMHYLLETKTDKEMDLWMKHCSSCLKSNRIRRKQEMATLETFF